MPTVLAGTELRAFEKVARDIESGIRAGGVPPGHNLPSQRDLAEHHGVTRQTVREALELLTERGLVRGDKLGTYALGERGGAPASEDAYENVFPQPLVEIDEASVPTAWLRRAPLVRAEAEALGVAPGRTGLVYEQTLLGPEGRVAQWTRSSFAPELLDRVPQLFRLQAALQSGPEPRIGAVLTSLLEWARRAGIDLSAGPAEPGDPQPNPTGTTWRELRDQHGRVCVRTAYRLHAAARRRAHPGGCGPALDARERAWLEAWALLDTVDGALALRSRIVLACQSATVAEVARDVGQSEAIVTAWRGRFAAGGPQALRADVRGRRGRPARERPDEEFRMS
ncbi:GntR family transcriptional regulator [Streptacidiphilus rugosus]|uniref:GntR family transcriptional regulator n=1 Tax=Streptacidiphilus rugosus TaxID=405783 RepID=UPI0012FA51FB|nr:GntR family transcriptional regulator [Streptacidiphilus rugosus]